MSTNTPNAMLTGGPADLGQSERIRHVTNAEERVKLLVGNGYEHFLPTTEVVTTEWGDLRVFEWGYRTRIAE